MKMEILVVVPARGGSKGIPRKNLRLLAGRPLLCYVINTAVRSRFAADVFVTSDDGEIIALAQNMGVRTIARDQSLAEDSTTLDPVVHDAVLRAEQCTGKRYELVATLQPTSPLLRVESLDAALQQMVDDPTLDTIIAARRDAHLTWSLSGGRYVPLYERRVNRQQLPPVFRETGAFLLSRRSAITECRRIGERVSLFELGGGEEIDIDSPDDWNLCEFRLKRRKIVFVVTGNSIVGLGHVYNTLLVANDILNHDVQFLVDSGSRMAHDVILARNYPVQIQTMPDIADDVLAMSADLVVNDCLDTGVEYVSRLKTAGLRVVNFEDLGPGAALADLVVNAIYPEGRASERAFHGPGYFILRDEFLAKTASKTREKVAKVLLTFGGVDPNNLTRKVLCAIYAYCLDSGIAISVVTGFGYDSYESLAPFTQVEIVRNAPNIADYMEQADVIFTSAGRTTYEIASLGVPSLVLAQNDRELTHCFASAENGFLHLGLGVEISDEDILQKFCELIDSPSRRRSMSEAMLATDLRKGRATVNRLINNLLETPGS
jgi:CMP-N-acetylneuraminic acid synthetase